MSPSDSKWVTVLGFLGDDCTKFDPALKIKISTEPEEDSYACDFTGTVAP